MSNNRIYDGYIPYDRLKLPRNKYGLDYTNAISTGSSIFGSSSGAGYSAGGNMVSLKDFKGCTIYEAGERGLVPAPQAGDQFKFLQATGAWIDIPAYRWFHEWPESAGLEKTGLEIDGDLSVTENLYVKNLQADQAHFWSLVIEEVKHAGGQVIVSPSSFKVDYVGEYINYLVQDAQGPLYQLLVLRDDIYKILSANNIETIRCKRLWQVCDDGDKTITNECMLGDMMRCRTWNIKEGEYRNVSNADYWSFIVNSGDGEFTDTEGNTRQGFYIDLAITLRDFDGHNYPIGTTLNIDGTVSYPNGFDQDTDIWELKKTSREVWDGSREVDPEFVENEEYVSIQEDVIKIRGLDDQIEDITGESSSNKLYQNTRFLNKAQSSLQAALYGVDSLVEDINTEQDLASLIVNGTLSDDVDQDNSSNRAIIHRRVDDITGPVQEIDDYFTVDKVKESTIKLKKGTTTHRTFTAKEDIVYWDDTEQVFVTQFEAGDEIPENTLLKGDGKVIDNNEEITVTDKEGEDITGEELNVIENGTEDTSTGKTRNVNDYIERVYGNSWLFGYVGDYSKFRIKEGDELVCLGNLYDEDRQNAIVLSSRVPLDKQLKSPAIAQYNHINIFGEDISKFRMTCISASGNEFTGSFLVENGGTYLDINEKINMMVTDIETGLEQCGIHLDGQNSSITMVGGVDLRQHDGSNSDTLSVYDSFDVKRVEIRPEAIPSPGTSGSQIDTSKKTFNDTQRTYIPVQYVNCTSERIWDFWPFSSHYVYTYTFDGYNPIFTVSFNLGYLQYGWKVDFRELSVNLENKAILSGIAPITDRGLGKQSVTTLRYTLKRNGLALQGYDNVDIKGSAEIGGINTDVISVFKSLIFDNYTVDTPGTYSIDVKLGVKTYGRLRTETRYDNYYFNVNNKLTGSCMIDVSREEVAGYEYDGYKMMIGTNGFSCMSDNSRYFYVGKDGVLIRWDDAYIEMNDTVGLRLRHFVRNITESTTLDLKYDVIHATSSGSAYTVTLPAAGSFGQGRTITIIGYQGLIVKTNAATSHIEIPILGTVYSIDQFTFSYNGPLYSVQLMAIGNNWYATSVC